MKIALITGGDSAEREVSLNSAKTVLKALQEKAELSVYDFPKDIDLFLREKDRFSVVIPVMHGRGGEDGQLQGFLETLSVPYIFSGITAHAIGIDKAIAKSIVSAKNVKTPASSILLKGESFKYRNPVVVKVIDEGSSQGIVIVKDSSQCDKVLQDVFLFSDRVLVEEFIEGREFTVGVIEENDQIVALPVAEIVVKDGFFDYNNKYDANSLAEEICPASIDDVLKLALESAAVTAHKAISASHLSRSDFIVDAEGVVWFLEINTIPGMTEASFVPKMLEVSGRDFGDLLLNWIKESM